MATKEDVIKAASTGVSLPSAMPQKLEAIEKMLSGYQLKIDQVAPKKGLQASRITALAATTIWMNPSLLECDPRSILVAVMQLAMSGINPSKHMKEAYLIPYGKECQMQLSYLGIVKLATKSALIKAIWARAVYEGDYFEISLGTTEEIVHRRGPNFGNAAKFQEVYAVVEMANGSKVFEVLNKIQIERLRLKSPMQKSGQPTKGAWASDYDQMAKAKVVKAVLKLIPLEDEYRSSIFLDESISSSRDFDDMTASNIVQPRYPDENEGSAEVVTEPATELTEDQQRQADFDAQAKKEASLSDLAK